MSGFAPGDVVVCVDDWCDDQAPDSGFLKTGHYYTAEGHSRARCCGFGVILAEDASYDRQLGFCPRRFRKIEKAEDEFTEYMRTMRPIKQRGKVEA